MEESKKNGCGCGSMETCQTQLSVFTCSRRYFSFPFFVHMSSQQGRIITWTFLLVLLICTFTLSWMFLLLNKLIYLLLRFNRKKGDYQNCVNGQPCILQILQTHLWSTCSELGKMPVKNDFLAWAFVHLLNWISNRTHSDVRLLQLKTELG